MGTLYRIWCNLFWLIACYGVGFEIASITWGIPYAWPCLFIWLLNFWLSTRTLRTIKKGDYDFAVVMKSHIEGLYKSLLNQDVEVMIVPAPWWCFWRPAYRGVGKVKS
jgi:hypothetical protein